jgi:predicted acylesterase/phospholipase RssA
MEPQKETEALPAVAEETKLFRVLTLDGGGAKGFYTLGALREIEGMVESTLDKRFDLIFGTSTGAIIAALLALGKTVDEIHALYKSHVVTVMAEKSRAAKTAALAKLAVEVFGDKKFDAVTTGVGIVTTKWLNERPMIFKGTIKQAHGRTGTFVPGFGCTIAEAVQASCSAYPFFDKKTVKTSLGDFDLIDGGFCANNPALYALADATIPLGIPRKNIRVVSVGVGEYPEPKAKFFSKGRWLKYVPSVTLLQKTLEINTQSMDQLRVILFRDVETVRINDAYTTPEMATDLFEYDLKKLNVLWLRGRESFAKHEKTLRDYLL